MSESLRTVKRAAGRLSRASTRTTEARQELVLAVSQARSNHTLEEIGLVLGVSKQAVYQLLKKGQNNDNN